MLEPVAQQASPDIELQICKFMNECRILKEEYDKTVPTINSLTFDSRLNWIKVSVVYSRVTISNIYFSDFPTINMIRTFVDICETTARVG